MQPLTKTLNWAGPRREFRRLLPGNSLRFACSFVWIHTYQININLSSDCTKNSGDKDEDGLAPINLSLEFTVYSIKAYSPGPVVLALQYPFNWAMVHIRTWGPARRGNWRRMEQSRQGARTQNQGGRNRLVTGISKYINKEVACLKGSVSSGMTRSRLRKNGQPNQRCHSCQSSRSGRWAEDIQRSEYAWALGQGSRPKRKQNKTPRTPNSYFGSRQESGY